MNIIFSKQEDLQLGSSSQYSTTAIKVLKAAKEKLTDESQVVVVDHSENYSFTVENSEHTVNPFIVYYKSATNQKINLFSVFLISMSPTNI